MKLQVLNSSDFGTIRTLQEEGVTMFCGTDVAKALGYGYARPNDAITAHCRSTVKRRIPHPQAEGNEKLIEMSFLYESDVYRLIAHSKLPTAQKFERWVFEEVLPTIRKTGSYNANPREGGWLTWRGDPVLTTRELARLNGVVRSSAYDKVVKSLKEGVDYEILCDGELRSFKAENPRVERNIVNLVVVNGTGCKKLAKRGISAPALPIPAPRQTEMQLDTQITLTRPIERPKKKYAVVVTNHELQECFKRIRKQLTAIDALIDLTSRYNVEASMSRALFKSLEESGLALFAEIGHAAHTPVMETEQQVI